MDRLTKRSGNVMAFRMSEENVCKAIQKLSEYEEINPDPEEIKTKLDELSELKRLESEGLYIRLPCKAGDILYEVDEASYKPIVCEVIDVCGFDKYFCHIKENGRVQGATAYVTVVEGHGKGSTYHFDLPDFGKTVFLSREEAEKAL